MSKVNFTDTVSIEQLVSMIPILSATSEDNETHTTPIIVSEPGCGKTSILKEMKKNLGDEYDYIYVDCPSKDLMDIAAAIPNHADKTLDQYIGSLFMIDSPKPKVIMLDEVFKVPKIMGVMFTRLMLERCVGDKALPVGSMVFGTSNNSSDGVGDHMQAHQGNRVCIRRMQKPDWKAWNAWATDNGISSTIRACVAMNTRFLASYLDGGQDDNPYIFNPERPKQSISFVSPRSLAKSDRVVRNRNVFGMEATKVALAGIVGEAAASQMSVFIEMEKQVIPTNEVIKSPEGVPVPTEIAALCIMMFNAVDDITTQDELTAYMKFMQRIKSSEMESIFFTMLMSNSKTTKLASNNETIKKWVTENYKLL
ncbi:MAG: ATP-binding protein [Candidatus Nanopelagicales bacterium]